jgi:hypothetical protein
LRQIEEFEIEEVAEMRLQIEVEGESRALLSVGRECRDSLSIEVFLWNRYPNLFREGE